MGLSRILVASDGLEPGEHALEVARTVASGAQAELRVISVETEGLPTLAGAHGVSRTSGSSATTWARGVPGVEIVREAEQWRADLVVLGRWSRSPGAPVRLGPTSDVVIRRRNGASLFVPGSVCCIRRVLIALDGTDRGLGILHGAASVVAALGATPIAVCVLSGALPGEPDSADPRAGRVSEALNRTEGLSGRTTLHILHGEPVPKILSLLEESRSDLLVVGVRGGGPQGEMGSGHVGRDLLQAVPAAILSIPI